MKDLELLIKMNNYYYYKSCMHIFFQVVNSLVQSYFATDVQNVQMKMKL
jgi:hypothetical protein